MQKSRSKESRASEHSPDCVALTMVNGRAGDVRGAEIAPTRQLPCLLAPSSWKSSYVAFSCRPPWTPPPKPDLNVEVYTRRKINLERCSTAEDGCGLDGNVRVGTYASTVCACFEERGRREQERNEH